MDHINELTSIIQIFFLWNKSRCQCMAQIMISLFATRTVNLSILSEAFISKAKSASCYKRILRFIDWLPITSTLQYKTGKLTIHILGLSNRRVHLNIDRTCWNFGLVSINFLVIGIEFNGISAPIWFKLLSKKQKRGNSRTEQRISILKQVIKLIKVDNIISFSADREFIGGKWFGYLVEQNIPFVIRIKKDSNYSHTTLLLRRNVEILCFCRLSNW